MAIIMVTTAILVVLTRLITTEDTLTHTPTQLVLDTLMDQEFQDPSTK